LILDFTFFAGRAFSDFRLVDMHHACSLGGGVLLNGNSDLGDPDNETNRNNRRTANRRHDAVRIGRLHGSGYEASGFSMASYDELLKGTKFGPMIIPGDSEGSNLIVLMEGRADPSIAMPHGDAERVSGADIDKIRRWIDQGAKKN
jgi:hypothetical protein